MIKQNSYPSNLNMWQHCAKKYEGQMPDSWRWKHCLEIGNELGRETKIDEYEGKHTCAQMWAFGQKLEFMSCNGNTLYIPAKFHVKKYAWFFNSFMVRPGCALYMFNKEDVHTGTYGHGHHFFNGFAGDDRTGFR